MAVNLGGRPLGGAGKRAAPHRSAALREALAEQPDDIGAEPYKVGYGKPPLHSRFGAGQAGGPGRPKGSKNRATLFAEAFDTPRPVTVNGQPAKRTNQELAYRQLAQKAAGGDLKAIELAERIRGNVCGPDRASEEIEPPLTEAELAILARRS